MNVESGSQDKDPISSIAHFSGEERLSKTVN